MEKRTIDLHQIAVKIARYKNNEKWWFWKEAPIGDYVLDNGPQTELVWNTGEENAHTFTDKTELNRVVKRIVEIYQVQYPNIHREVWLEGEMPIVMCYNANGDPK